MQLPAAKGATLLRGEIRTCRDYADLDYALDHPNSDYFKGWTTNDFDAAQAWISSCSASPPTARDDRRESLLAERRAALEARGEIQRNDESIKKMHETELREQQEKEAALKAEETRRNAEEAKEHAAEAQRLANAEAKEAERRAAESKALADRQAKQAAHNDCLYSYAYRRYEAQANIIDALDRASEAQRALDHEKRVEEASETTNLLAKRYAGESLVAAQDDLNRWWAVYQQYGGDAKSPQSVSRLTENPCK